MSRQRINRITPSFFPFISVLIAIIGSLIFMTLTMTLTALSPELVIETPMEWVPDEDGEGGTNRQRKMLMIECSDDKATLLVAEGGDVSEKIGFNADKEWKNIARIYSQHKKDDPDAWQGTPFLDFINETAIKQSTHFIVFLLRPSGVHSYALLSDILKIRNAIEFDKEKYPDANKQWVADWSLVYVEEDREVVTL